MDIKFQKENFCIKEELANFSNSNKSSGSIMAFLGKVRPLNGNRKIESIDIEFYEKMALYQTKIIILKLLKKYSIKDYLIVHRYGNLIPGENIVLVLVASKHRKESFIFLESIIDWLKVKITFWKRENYLGFSEWIE
ncbi:MAG: molybdenum cofactor biosynthesis protein MoaE [Pseudomonadota bacterium]|nr:molybdenum cofactor biosynthesis protein MoaE [Pseudomonadota bacterium]